MIQRNRYFGLLQTFHLSPIVCNLTRGVYLALGSAGDGTVAYLGHRLDRHATPSRKPNPVRFLSSISKYTMNVNRTIPRDSLPREDSLSPDPQQSLHVVRAARSVSMNDSNQDAPIHQDNGAVLHSQQYMI